VPPEQWPDSPAARQRIERNWEWPQGDRRQELVIIGIGIDAAAIRHGLDKCLLSDLEMHIAPECWSQFDDPFPSWAGIKWSTCSAHSTLIRNR
jgi:hypothetical protein